MGGGRKVEEAIIKTVDWLGLLSSPFWGGWACQVFFGQEILSSCSRSFVGRLIEAASNFLFYYFFSFFKEQKSFQRCNNKE